ncbi:3-oxoacyl-[acyl-carrier protein] reductase [Marinobacter nitratireducens]|uniref:3-oxoacyl-[acyl-carrier protein] reductase n=1 Tax=Marinobacter nitratireducens TaxID=1137280 RepID=A0A072N372_9GAMM|nr:SDR family oxidoreductase [Marinobacter nitratireducens]KEF31657.1 3-oxoacyl-[acyl-carrier protein] reductase [Marinobacter nitratireducens]
MTQNSPKLFSLEHKTVLVTGATGYLGRAISFGLAALGARVLVNGRSPEKVDELVASLHGTGGEALSAAFDVSDENSVKDWFVKFADQPLDGLVNNAYAGTAGSIETANAEDYRGSYEVTMVAAHQMLSAALPALRLAVQKNGAASVVNMGSMYGIVSPDQRIYAGKSVSNPPFYGAAKAALLQWTRYAACEFGPEGIRVNAVSPGPFPSDAVQQSNPDFIRSLSQKVPLGRIGVADELQGPLGFLLSDASSYVNGANLSVDGGWTCW